MSYCLLEILMRKQNFNQVLEGNPCSFIITSEEISNIIDIYSGTCPSVHGALRQRYYRMRKKYIVKNNTLYHSDTPTGNLLQVVPKDKLFDLFDKVHGEDGKHLGRDR